MAQTLMGKKRGMTQLFDSQGNITVGTVIEMEPNTVTQVKTKETDGYDAIQVGFEKIKVKDARTMANRVTKPLLGHFKKNGIEPRRYLTETKVGNIEAYTIGQDIGVTAFAEVAYVDVTGVSKGKGHQGVMKRYHFRGGRASHGSGFHRHGGSTGMRTTPGRCLPGQKKSGHMGNEQVTVQNLKVVMINEADSVLVVEGAIPGPRGALVYVAPAKKKTAKKK